MKTTLSSLGLRIGLLMVLLATGAAAQTGQPPTLKDAYKGHFYVGVAVNRSIVTGEALQFGNRTVEQVGKDSALTKEQFNQISPENDLKWESIHPREGADGYNFGPADAYVNFGLKNHMFLVGHTLVWHGQTPNWVFAGAVPPPDPPATPGPVPPANGPGGRFGRGFGRGFGYNGPRATREELLQRMRDHIHAVVGRYRGKVKVWDVVNEAIADGGPNTLRDSLWRQIIGPDFIAKAFEYAHEADPKAILRYNDYGLENPAKRQKLITLIKQLQAEKVPVMAIGTQTHVSVSSPSFEEEDRELTDLETLGLPIHITELDVNGAQAGQRNTGADVANNAATTQGGLVGDADQRLADQYAALFKAFLKHKSVKVVTLWGVNDGVSWRAGGKPLLFDANDQPKPAFGAVIHAASGGVNTSAQEQSVPDKSFYVFLSFGQSNMEGFPGIEEQDKGPVDARFRVLAAVDFPDQKREKGHWYTAVPPLARPGAGLGPSDYFGRTLAAHLPASIKIGIVNVSVAGCKIEMFDKDHSTSYAETAPPWMKNIIAAYGGDPYRRLIEMARLAQKVGVIRGVLLHQGESNTNDKEWPNKVKGVYDNLIKDLDLKPQEVPLLAGELLSADQNGACASMNAIIDDLPKTIPNSYVISSAGCPSRPDHLHFTPAGYREFGKRYGEKMLSLLGHPVAGAKAAADTRPAQPGGGAAGQPAARKLPMPILPALPDAADTLFYANSNVPHGRVEQVTYRTSTGLEKRLHVYSPPDYQTNLGRRYPVLYLNHGGGEDDSKWTATDPRSGGFANLILDNLIAARKAKPMIVVMPDSRDLASGDAPKPGVEDACSHEYLTDIIPFVDGHYRTKPARNCRALAGLSMGGFVVLNTGLAHLDAFGELYVFSSGYWPDRLAAFQENARAVLGDPAINDRFRMPIYFAAGETDIAFTNSQKTLAVFNGYGIRTFSTLSSGGHEWMNWRRYLHQTAQIMFPES